MLAEKKRKYVKRKASQVLWTSTVRHGRVQFKIHVLSLILFNKQRFTLRVERNDFIFMILNELKKVYYNVA